MSVIVLEHKMGTKEHGGRGREALGTEYIFLHEEVQKCFSERKNIK